MKLGFKILFAAGFIASGFFSVGSPDVNTGVDLKSIVACEHCK